MFAHRITLVKYRKILYERYYSTHSGVDGVDAQRAHFEQQRRYFRREFESLMPSDKSGRILDIGCGTGSFIQAMRDAGYTNIEGVDLSPEQVKMADEFGVPGVHLGAAEDFLSKADVKYDVITAIDLIEHLTKDELVDFLRMVHDALQVGGKVLFRTPNMDAPQASVFAFADFTHEIFLNKNSGMQVMDSCGFSEVQVVPGFVFIENPIKEFFRRILWWKYVTWKKLILFASARTWDDVIFTPNMVLTGLKGKG